MRELHNGQPVAFCISVVGGAAEQVPRLCRDGKGRGRVTGRSNRCRTVTLTVTVTAALALALTRGAVAGTRHAPQVFALTLAGVAGVGAVVAGCLARGRGSARGGGIVGGGASCGARLFALPAHKAVPDVFDGVVGAAGQALSDLRPAIAELLLLRDHIVTLQADNTVSRLRTMRRHDTGDQLENPWRSGTTGVQKAQQLCMCCSKTQRASQARTSSALNGPFLISGHSWLNHRRRQDLPLRAGTEPSSSVMVCKASGERQHRLWAFSANIAVRAHIHCCGSRQSAALLQSVAQTTSEGSAYRSDLRPLAWPMFTHKLTEKIVLLQVAGIGSANSPLTGWTSVGCRAECVRQAVTVNMGPAWPLQCIVSRRPNIPIVACRTTLATFSQRLEQAETCITQTAQVYDARRQLRPLQPTHASLLGSAHHQQTALTPSCMASHAGSARCS